ncbi:cytochrome o ubiquinol oxidase subunit IV [Buchnera aphidicola (Neophyllaphis podocarpi)]|uniref:cytochrome o ubiquinol oxidase subunit IV n=1 Tax=Buchnera aphidicola TaxID=9 RepID=UPI0031B82C56
MNNNLDINYIFKIIRYYLIGFISSVFLTSVPFLLFEYHFYPKKIVIALIILCAVLQILIHFKYFISVHILKKDFIYHISLFFVILIIFIIIFGSIWIMYHLNSNN